MSNKKVQDLSENPTALKTATIPLQQQALYELYQLHCKIGNFYSGTIKSKVREPKASSFNHLALSTSL